MNDGVLAYIVAVATVTAGATGWRRLTLTLTTAGGGRDNEGSRFTRSFFMETNLCWPVSVGCWPVAVGERTKVGTKIPVGKYKNTHEQKILIQH